VSTVCALRKLPESATARSDFLRRFSARRISTSSASELPSCGGGSPKSAQSWRSSSVLRASSRSLVRGRGGPTAAPSAATHWALPMVDQPGCGGLDMVQRGRSVRSAVLASCAAAHTASSLVALVPALFAQRRWRASLCKTRAAAKPLHKIQLQPTQWTRSRRRSSQARGKETFSGAIARATPHLLITFPGNKNPYRLDQSPGQRRVWLFLRQQLQKQKATVAARQRAGRTPRWASTCAERRVLRPVASGGSWHGGAAHARLRASGFTLNTSTLQLPGARRQHCQQLRPVVQRLSPCSRPQQR
jgi:hypothetical protein